VISESFQNAYRAAEGLYAGEYPGDIDPAIARAKMQALIDAGVRRVFDLTEAGELRPYDTLLASVAASNGVEVVHERISMPDSSAPAVSRMRTILESITHTIARGEAAFVHCRGGVGRTGTVVGCYLVQEGTSGVEALAMVDALFRTMSPEKVRRFPGGSPQTARQRELIRSWNRRARTSATPTPTLVAQVRGCLLGGAAGDALRPGGVLERISNDTQLTLFTAEGLLRSITRERLRGTTDESIALQHAYHRWLQSQGLGEAAGHHDAQGWLGSVPALIERRAPERDRMGTSVMRSAPAGLFADYFPEHAFHVGRLVHEAMNADASGAPASGAFAMIIRQLLDGERLTDAAADAAARLRDEPGGAQAALTLDAALDRWRANSLHGGGNADHRAALAAIGTGWRLDEALAMGLYAALAQPDSFEDAVSLAIAHGGNTEATGSIAGHLIGVIGGEDAIPDRWRAELELASEIREVADDVVAVYRDTEAWRRRYPPSKPARRGAAGAAG
jgi:ADP-ribosylglycohydrolase/protein-tyrosine phosphatase